jgi:hypothetical protein
LEAVQTIFTYYVACDDDDDNDNAKRLSVENFHVCKAMDFVCICVRVNKN